MDHRRPAQTAPRRRRSSGPAPPCRCRGSPPSSCRPPCRGRGRPLFFSALGKGFSVRVVTGGAPRLHERRFIQLVLAAVTIICKYVHVPVIKTGALLQRVLEFERAADVRVQVPLSPQQIQTLGVRPSRSEGAHDGRRRRPCTTKSYSRRVIGGGCMKRLKVDNKNVSEK